MQVVLEDGRVIQEDVPEVTVDTTEDRQSHVESDAEDRDIADNDRMPISITDGNDDRASDRHNVVGDRQFRNTRTKDVLQQSSTTAAAQVRFLRKVRCHINSIKLRISFSISITTI